MKACIVYHSETGNTERVAQALAEETGAELIRVRDCADYSAITRYLIGARIARRCECATIVPAEIDVSGSDVIVVGSPVWAWHPTPAVNAAIKGLKGCEGKRGMVFATSGGMPGDTLRLMSRMLRERGVRVIGEFHFARKEIPDREAIHKKIAPMVDAILKA